jgi:alcohol dehydrogenase (cytochrome c)
VVSEVAAAEPAAAGSEWTTPSGTVEGTRYSSLTDITSSNVSTLVEEFSISTGTKDNHEGQPLVVGQTMYIVTPFPNKLIALDLRSPGRVLWTFNPQPSEYAQGVACCDVVNRGAAYAKGKIIYSLLDDTVVAVDAKTGVQVWRTRLGRPQTGETLTGAPIIVNDKVIVGNAGGEMGIRGWVQALDVNTGKPVWKAYNTGPDADVKIGANFHAFYQKDRGANLGSASWPGTLWKQGGATVWNWFTYDPDQNLVYYGTSNPGVWNPDMRLGDNKWGATIFARNPDTGEAVWAYQVTPHDGWDFDSISESIVVDLSIGGVTRKSLVHFDKNGFAYTIDRTTGEVLVANKFATVTWADHVDLTTGAPIVNPGMDPHEGVITKNICPSPLGGKEYTPAAYSPKTNLFYVPGINFCQNFEPLRAMFISGTPFLGANAELFPGPNDSMGQFFMGELIAWDAVTGARRWSLKETLPLYSGVLATAGNVVFYGTLDRWFKAVDATTGQVLFQKQLECGVAGNPISYTAPDGKQRIAVYTGTGWLTGGFAGGACPAGNREEDDEKTSATPGTSSGGMVHVFKLPS